MYLFNVNFLRVLFLLFLSTGILYQIEGLAQISNMLLVMTSILIIGVTLIINKGKILIQFSWLDFLYLTFLFSLLISVFVNNDFDIFVSLIKLLLYYLVLSVCVRNLHQVITQKFFYLGSFVVGLLILIFNLISAPNFNEVLVYRGLFENPNSFGLFLASFLIIVVGFLFLAVSKQSIVVGIILFILSLFCFYLMLISNSRTSFIGVISSIILLIGIYYSKSLKKKNFKISLINIFVFFLVAIIILFMIVVIINSPIGNALYNNIFAKFSRQSSDLTSGRTMIWKLYLNNLHLFGSEYTHLSNALGVSSHNSFIYMVSRFGLLPGILNILVWVGAAIKLVKYSSSNENLYFPFIFMSIFLFISMSIMEVLNYTFIMYIAFYSISEMVYPRKN